MGHRATDLFVRALSPIMSAPQPIVCAMHRLLSVGGGPPVRQDLRRRSPRAPAPHPATSPLRLVLRTFIIPFKTRPFKGSNLGP